MSDDKPPVAVWLEQVDVDMEYAIHQAIFAISMLALGFHAGTSYAVDRVLRIPIDELLLTEFPSQTPIWAESLLADGKVAMIVYLAGIFLMVCSDYIFKIGNRVFGS